jgi:hypothetical protein
MKLRRLPILASKFVLLVFIGSCWCVAGRAQDSFAKTFAPECSPENVDPEIRVSVSHGDSQMVEISLRNISGHSCYLPGELPANFMTAKSGAEITINPVQVCFNCGQDGKSRWSEPLLLFEGGQTARQTFAWTNKVNAGNGSCFQVNLLEFFLQNKFLVLWQTQNPSLTVCSAIEVRPFSLGIETDDPEISDTNAKSLKLSAERGTYYEGQAIRLRLEVEEPEIGAPAVEQECARLFERVRSPEGFERIDQVGSAWDTNCKVTSTATSSSKRIVAFDVNSGHNNRWGGVGEHTIQFIDTDGTLPDEWLRRATSNVLHLQIADPATIKRTWGKRVEGLAADVTIDKDSYELGKDIPIHLAVENFSANVPIYGASPVWNPCDVLRVEVRDSVGQLVRGNHPHPCMGGGPSGAWRYATGKVVPLEWSLDQLGMSPERPGVYTVVAIWNPFQGSDYTCELCQVTANEVVNARKFVVRSNVAVFSIRDAHR